MKHTVTIIFLALAACAGRADTSADQRDHIRSLVDQRDVAQQALNAQLAKVNQSIEAKAVVSLQKAIDDEVNKLKEQCKKGGQELAIDQAKHAEAFLHCITPTPAPKK